MKRNILEYTVVQKMQMPEKLEEIIEKNKSREIRITYTEGEKLFLVRGYGEQKGDGYQIEVVECSEDEDSILFDTRLLGPAIESKNDQNSFPVLVIQTEAREKNVIFQ